MLTSQETIVFGLISKNCAKICKVGECHEWMFDSILTICTNMELVSIFTKSRNRPQRMCYHIKEFDS